MPPIVSLQPFLDAVINRRLLHHLGDPFARISPIPWLINGVLEGRAITLLFGPPACGKSFVALSLAASIATHQPWMGQPVHGGGVIYINGEGRNGVARRLAAWSANTNTPLTHSPFFITEHPVNLTEHKSMMRFMDEATELEREPTRLIIVDTVARCFGNADENSTRAMNAFISNIDNLRHTFGCAVLLVHHSGHHGLRARGSSALKAAVDAEYRIGREEMSGQLELVATKMKDAPLPDPMYFKLNQVQVREGISSAILQPITNSVAQSVGVRYSKHPILVLDLLRFAAETDWSWQRYPNRYFECSRQMADTVIARGIAMGFICRNRRIGIIEMTSKGEQLFDQYCKEQHGQPT